MTLRGDDLATVRSQIDAVPTATLPELPPGRAVRFVADSATVAPAPTVPGEPDWVSVASVEVEVLSDAIRVHSYFLLPPERDPISDLVPPLGLVLQVLEGTRLPVAPTSRGAALVALARLRVRDGVGASKALEGAVATPGVRVLRAYAALASRQYPAVHEALYGLGEDVALGPVARLLSGAALRADGNVREAVRDFEAATKARPAYWPARLLAAEAYESADLRFPDKAAAAYAAAADSAPHEPAVLLGHAYHRVLGKDGGGARTDVERLLAAYPDVVAAWRLLSWMRTQSGTSDDLRAAAEALEHVTAIDPADARAWGELGGARWRWAVAGGSTPALLAASDAFGHQATLTPHDGLAWFNQGGTLHEAATRMPLAGDAAPFRERLAAARTYYAKALASGMPRKDGARVHFNVGLLLETLPSLAPPSDGLPVRASDAFSSALLADPTYVAAALALVASRVAEKDGPGAAKALAALPPGADPREVGVLQAGAAWLRGDAAAARSLLVGEGRVAVEGPDVLPALARSFLVLGYRRAASVLLTGAADDAAKLTLLLRADAGLRDLTALRSDLDALARLDRRAAAELREKDPEVVAALGAVPPPEVPSEAPAAEGPPLPGDAARGDGK